MSPSTFFLVFPMFFFLIKSSPDDDISVLIGANHCRPSTPCKKNGKFKDISYPFWRLDDNSPTVCGYPGFGINCSNPNPNFPLLYHSDNAFLVKDISYADYTITLVDADVITNETCPRARHNFTLTEKLPLFYNSRESGDYLKLTFYFNCTENPLPGDAATYPIECLKSDQKESYLYVGATNPYHSDWFRFCEVEVETTVMEKGELGYDKEWWNKHFAGAMNDGFVVKYWPELEDCGYCNIPEGWCGQDKHFGEFLCFCNGNVIHDCPSKGKRVKMGMKIGIGIGGVLVALCSVVFCTILYAYRRREKGYPFLGTNLTCQAQ